MTTKPVSIVCMKWGNKYGPEYVNRMYNMIKRNITRPFRLVCYTDSSKGIIPEVEIHKLPPFSPYNGSIMSAYRKKTMCRADLEGFDKGDRFLFLDLDVVIMGNIDDMFDYEPDKDFVICYNWTRGNGKIGNSSVTMMRVGPLQYIIDDLEKDFDKYRAQYKTASQEYMSAKVIEKYGKLTFWPDEWCKSFQLHSMAPKWQRLFKAPIPPPQGTKILIFHGAVNPPDAIKGLWPGKVPFWKKWYKTVKPAPWLAEYWH